MQETGVSSIALEYATDRDAGDTRATEVLIRVLRWMLYVDITTRLVLAVTGLRSMTLLPARLNWPGFVWLALEAAQIYALIRCVLAMLDRQRRGNGVFYLAFGLLMLRPLVFMAINFDLATGGRTLITHLSYLTWVLAFSSYLLLLPLLRGRESAQWLSRLTWLAIGMLAVCIVPWIQGTVLRFFYEDQRPMNGAIYIRPTWNDAGILVCMVAMFFLRHEHNRILLRLAAGWLVMALGIHLYESGLSPFVYTFTNWYYLISVFIPNMVRSVVLAIPSLLLLWFTFRFTDAQRQDMGRRVQMAVVEP